MAVAPDCLAAISTAFGRPAQNKYQCLVCGFCYDEAAGMPCDGILAGTRWESVPVRWLCPLCGAAKKAFGIFDQNL